MISLFLLTAFVRAQPIVGVARKDGRILYREKTELTRENDRIVRSNTRYEGPDGQLLAELSSRFTRPGYVPEIDFTDHRDGYGYTVRFQSGDALEIREKDSAKDPWVTLTDKSPVHLKPDLLVIQSIPAYAFDHLADLRAGRALSARFLVPSSADDFAMRVERVGADPKRKDVTTLKVESGNWLIRQSGFFPTFTLEVDLERRRLLKFTGISNIMDELGTIQIEYE